jgi:hypothetical protein
MIFFNSKEYIQSNKHVHGDLFHFFCYGDLSYLCIHIFDLLLRQL